MAQHFPRFLFVYSIVALSLAIESFKNYVKSEITLPILKRNHALKNLSSSIPAFRAFGGTCLHSRRRRRVVASSSSRTRDLGTESRFVPRESLVYVSAVDPQLGILKYYTRVFAFKPNYSREHRGYLSPC